VAAATLMAAVKITGAPLTEQRIALLGAGSAGCGIANLILKAMMEAGADEATARRNFYAVDRNGLLVDGMNDITDAQQPFVQARSAVEGWTLQKPGEISLYDVAVNAKPTVLIGVSGQAGAFSEPVVRAMAEHTERPIILPLSNPTSRSEATAEQLVAWTDGRALIGSGSPFYPVDWKGKTFHITQTNNSYIFPGMGLGILASGARRVTDAMFMVAAVTLSQRGSVGEDGMARLLPPISELRPVSVEVAQAVARQAQADGVADPCPPDELDARIHAYVWEPHYRPYCKTD
jgi:malate dehydrogenase (oxaloacetate-decarboxylating)